jgi:predicted lipase
VAVINALIALDSSIPKEVILKSVKNCVDVYAHKNDFIVDKSIPGYCILAIEGTNETSDWATNLSFLFRTEDTHRGFQGNATRTITNLVLNYESLEKDRKLILTGHSLGGATATLVADLMLKSTPDLAIITIGSPRPGGRGLRKRLKNVEHLRFVHGDDVVPSTPPFLAGYVHTHPKIQLEDDDDKRFDGIEDHNAVYYYKALEKLFS